MTMIIKIIAPTIPPIIGPVLLVDAPAVGVPKYKKLLP